MFPTEKPLFSVSLFPSPQTPTKPLDYYLISDPHPIVLFPFLSLSQFLPESGRWANIVPIIVRTHVLQDIHIVFFDDPVKSYRRRQCIWRHVQRKIHGGFQAVIKVTVTSICIARLCKHLQCAQIWMTQYYLQATPYLPLPVSISRWRHHAYTHSKCLSSTYYSFIDPQEDESLSWPWWLVRLR